MQLRKKEQKAALLERSVNFGMAAGFSRVHDPGAAILLQPYAWPLRCAGQHHDRNLPACKILLVTNALVRSEQ